MSVIPIVKKILEYRKTGTVIDIGVGQGHHAIFLAEQGFVSRQTGEKLEKYRADLIAQKS